LPGPYRALRRTGGGVPPRLSLRTWTPMRTSRPPPLRPMAHHSRWTRHGDQCPCRPSELGRCPAASVQHAGVQSPGLPRPEGPRKSAGPAGHDYPLRPSGAPGGRGPERQRPRGESPSRVRRCRPSHRVNRRGKEVAEGRPPTGWQHGHQGYPGHRRVLRELHVQRSPQARRAKRDAPGLPDGDRGDADVVAGAGRRARRGPRRRRRRPGDDRHCHDLEAGSAVAGRRRS
jgi:hypothetical protein